MEQHEITFRIKTQAFTNIVNFDVSPDELMTVFHSSLIAVGFNHEVIIKGLAQYASDRDYGYQYCETPLTLGDASNFVITVKSKYNTIKVELPYDATIIDLINAWKAILTQMTFCQKTIDNHFAAFVEEYEDALWEEVVTETVQKETNTENTEEPKKFKSNDPFIQKIIDKSK